MKKIDKIAVCSRSFSRNSILRNELLAKYSYVKFNDEGLQMNEDQLVDFLRGYDKAVIALEKITDTLLSQLPEIKVMSKYGVGLDMIDMHAMRRFGVKLGWKGGVNRRSVSELVIAFALTMLRHLPIAHKDVLRGEWNQHIGGLLSGRTVGIIGCGHIGKDLIKLLQPWGCTLLAHDLLVDLEFNAAHSVQAVSLNDLLYRSDVISLHLPLDETTKNILSVEKLKLIKSEAILINTARGGLVDEQELKAMLESNRLAGAAFDVFNTEPPSDSKLLNLQNFYATPHIGGSAEESILAMGRSAIQGLEENCVP